MAKDPKGHGSNAKDIARAKAALAAQVAKRGDVPTEPKPIHDGHPKTDEVDDNWGSHNAMYGSRASDGYRNNEKPKGNFGDAARSFADKTAVMSASKGRSYNEHGSRHGYNPSSVDKAIKNNRTGKIGGREASAIHRLLKGR